MKIHFADTYITKKKILDQHNSDQIYIIGDMDGTLTSTIHPDTTKILPSVISVLREMNILDEDYSMKTKAMFDHYHLIEKDLKIDKTIKDEYMQERREKHYDLLIEKKLNKSHIEILENGNYIFFKKYLKELLYICIQKHIPFIVFSSAGLGCSYFDSFVDSQNISKSNIYTIGNHLQRDIYDNMIGYQKPLIHASNKSDSIIYTDPQYTDIKKSIQDRKYAILLGDSVADVDMISHLDSDHILKIGFTNNDDVSKIDLYKTIYDVVISGEDADMSGVADILNTQS